METGDGHSDEQRDDGRTAYESVEEARDEREAPPAGGRFDFERGWMVAAVVLLVTAAALLYFVHPEAAFVAAALGVSAWFLNVRSGLKRRHDLVKRGARNWEPRGRAEEERDSFQDDD